MSRDGVTASPAADRTTNKNSTIAKPRTVANLLQEGLEFQVETVCPLTELLKLSHVERKRESSRERT